MANIADRLGLGLSEIAHTNLERTRNRYGVGDKWLDPNASERLDARFDEMERFPDKMAFQFREEVSGVLGLGRVDGRRRLLVVVAGGADAASALTGVMEPSAKSDGFGALVPLSGRV